MLYRYEYVTSFSIAQAKEVNQDLFYVAKRIIVDSANVAFSAERGIFDEIARERRLKGCKKIRA